MKTIKVIDLINSYRLKDMARIEIRKDNWFVLEAEYENIPEEIKNKEVCDFCFRDDDKLVVNFSSDECIEIIEENKEIEKVLDIELLGQCDNWLQKRDVNIKSEFELNPYILEAITRNFKILYHKQCELIDVVNELKKK